MYQEAFTTYNKTATLNSSGRTGQPRASDSQHALLHGILNKFRVPVAAIDRHGVIACNSQMQGFIAQQPLLEINEDGRFQALDIELNEALQSSVADTLRAVNRSAGDTGDALVFAAQNEHNLSGFTLGIEAIHNAEELHAPASLSPGLPAQPPLGALLYAIAPQIVQTPSIEQLRRVFQLTEAEARCCHLFASGLPLKQVAGQEHKSIYTVREQIENAYRKTGARSQLELINMLAALPACG